MCSVIQFSPAFISLPLLSPPFPLSLPSFFPTLISCPINPPNLHLLSCFTLSPSLIFFQTVPLSIAGVLLAIQWFTQPYKDCMANITEAFCLTVLVIVLCLGDATHLVTLAIGDPNFTLWPLFYLPVMVGGVCLCAVIGRQIWWVWQV